MTQGVQRRLATIVAIDVVGFSKRTEADEVKALADVATLRQMITVVATDHGGALFHSAGDGFLLHFSNVTGALSAARDIVKDTVLPVRLGVHVGEVTVAEDGDLMGHGVNVVARLQARAPVGGVLVSGDVMRAERGEFAQFFEPQGRIKLDKMHETLPVYLFNSMGRKRSRWYALRLHRRWKVWLPVSAVVGVALVALMIMPFVPPNGIAQGRVAILPFVADSDTTASRSIARAVGDQIATRLNNASMPVVSQADATLLRGADAASRARALGVSLLFGGSVEDDGKTVDLRLRIDDPAHATLWTTEVKGPLASANALRNRIVSTGGGSVLRPAGDPAGRPVAVGSRRPLLTGMRHVLRRGQRRQPAEHAEAHIDPTLDHRVGAELCAGAL